MGLKKLRIDYDYSQEQLAEESNLSIRTIQRIEKENRASDSSLYQLAKVFDLDFEELKSIVEVNKIEEEKSFFSYVINHPSFVKFSIINIFLFLLNITTSKNTLWFYYVLVPWGFVLIYNLYEEFCENKKKLHI